MYLVTRKKGAQRSSKPIELTFCPNFTGQGGEALVTLLGSDGRYYILAIDSLEEGKELLSQAHIAYHNVVDKLHKAEVIAEFLKPKEKSSGC